MDKNLIRKQILAIKDSGVTNMFDVPRVTLEAEKKGLLNWFLT